MMVVNPLLLGRGVRRSRQASLGHENRLRTDVPSQIDEHLECQLILAKGVGVEGRDGVLQIRGLACPLPIELELALIINSSEHGVELRHLTQPPIQTMAIVNPRVEVM